MRSGHTDLAPHLAPLKNGDRESQSRLERQKQQRKEMNQRVYGPLLAIVIFGMIFGLIFWLR